VGAPATVPSAPQLIYSPWSKFCIAADPPNPMPACLTGKDARTEEGQLAVAAALIEQQGEQKVLRITLPVEVLLSYGTRIVIDSEPAMTAPYAFCSAAGCFAEFEGTADLVGKLKKGQTLNIQAVDLARNAFTRPLPLLDSAGNSFAKASEGPPIDSATWEERQKKLREELEKRAEDARKKRESQGTAPTGAP
jgi:invasion protein IalB